MTEAGVIDTAAEAKRERLHPLSLLTGIGTVVKQAWAALAGALFFFAQGRGELGLLIIGAAVIGTLVSIAVRLFSFSFRIEEDEIDIASGILNRNQRSIPFDRVQDVNIEQNPIARVLGLARVKLETGASAGDKNDDGVLDSIALSRAQDLRDRIRAHRGGTATGARSDATAETPPEAQDATLFVLTPQRLALLALFSFSLAIVGAFFGIAQTYGDALGLDPFSESFWRDNLSRVGPLRDLIEANRFVSILFGILSLLAVGVISGIVRVVPRDWGFTLARTESGLRRRRGLFTLTDVAMPLKRVQAAILSSGPVRRHFGYSAMSLQSLARDAGSGDHVIAPLATDGEVAGIIDSMEWPELPSIDEPGWHRPARAFISAFAVVSVPVVAMISVGIAATVAGIRFTGMTDLADPFDGAIVTTLAAFFIVYGIALLSRMFDWRFRQHRIHEGRLLVRRGWWRRRLVILPLNRIQSIDLKRSFLKRWFGIADLRFGVAGGSGFSAHEIEALPEAEAHALRQRLLEPVE